MMNQQLYISYCICTESKNMQWVPFSYFIDEQSVMDCKLKSVVDTGGGGSTPSLLDFTTLFDRYAEDYDELGHCSMVI